MHAEKYSTHDHTVQKTLTKGAYRLFQCITISLWPWYSPAGTSSGGGGGDDDDESGDENDEDSEV